jgi:hypothetical protein
VLAPSCAHACANWFVLQELITELIKASPTFKPPADYKPEKKFRKWVPWLLRQLAPSAAGPVGQEPMSFLRRIITRLRIRLTASRFAVVRVLVCCPATATRLRIPLEQYPGYNFIGLIIGPRGNTHRRLEQVRQQDRLQDRPQDRLQERQHAGRCQHAVLLVSRGVRDGLPLWRRLLARDAAGRGQHAGCALA